MTNRDRESRTLQNIFKFGTEAGHGPIWRHKGRELIMVLEHRNKKNELTTTNLVVIAKDNALIFLAGLLDANEYDQLTRDCINEVFFGYNLGDEIYFYGLDKESDKVFIRCNMLISGDDEVDITTHYVEIRHSIMLDLERLPAYLKDVLDCVEKRKNKPK